jgi:hypothetical protein
MSLCDTSNYATNNSFSHSATDSTAQQARGQVWIEDERADSPIHRRGTKTGEIMRATDRVRLVVFLENTTAKANLYESAFKIAVEKFPEIAETLNAALDLARQTPRSPEQAASIEEMLQLAQHVHWETQNPSVPE